MTLVLEPVKILYSNIARAQALKRSFGPWQGKGQGRAQDSKGQYRIPMLQALQLEGHLDKPERLVSGSVQEDTDATQKEQGGSRFPWGGWQTTTPKPEPVFLPPGSACWCYLLFALGVRPETDVVTWKPSPDGLINTQNGGIEIEVDGSVLCGIINLYSTTLDPSPWGCSWPEELPDRRKQKHCDFPFGRLSWNTNSVRYTRIRARRDQ